MGILFGHREIGLTLSSITPDFERKKKNFSIKVFKPLCKIPENVMKQPTFTCSKSTLETPEQCVKSVQS